MHTSSKVLLCIVPLLALFGFYEAGKLATKRNEVKDKIVVEKAKRDQNIAAIAKAKNTRTLEAEAVNRLMLEWGRQWTAQGQTDATTGQVLINVGTQQGLGAQEAVAKRGQPILYVFATMPDGTSKFLGEFTAEAQQQRTILTLNGPRYPAMLQTWPAQGDFRVRERIPPGQRAIFQDLANQQAISDQIVINEAAKIKIQDNHIASSQKTLDGRMAELNGDPAAPQTADPAIVNGLVDTIRVEEAERNKVLKDVDALRRQLSDNYARLEQVLAENRQAVDALAAGTEPAATPAGTRSN